MEQATAAQLAALTDGWHDACVAAGILHLTDQKLRRLYMELPDNLKQLAATWGTQDTVFREQAAQWLDSTGRTS